MITVINRQLLYNVPFDEYLKLPGTGYSAVKNPGTVDVTPKMQLGKAVDAYLFTPWEYSHGANHAQVKALAIAVKNVIGGLKIERQVSILADFYSGGKTLNYRGRPDIVVSSARLVIDLKVSELDIYKAVSHFRYDWQLSGYTLGLGYAQQMLLSVNPKTLKVSTLMLPIQTDWWEAAIKVHGK